VASGTLLAVSYADPATAERALTALVDLEDAHGLRIRDAVVVERDGSGDVRLRQKHGLAAGEGVVGGGSLGLLLGLAIGFPIAGALAGVAGGGGITAIDTGIPDDELRRLGRSLERGRGALFALVADADWSRVRDALAPYEGELVTSELTADAVARLAGTAP
jgi:uncharacterized membrane protein